MFHSTDPRSNRHAQASGSNFPHLYKNRLFFSTWCYMCTQNTAREFTSMPFITLRLFTINPFSISRTWYITQKVAAVYVTSWSDLQQSLYTFKTECTSNISGPKTFLLALFISLSLAHFAFKLQGKISFCILNIAIRMIKAFRNQFFIQLFPWIFPCWVKSSLLRNSRGSIPVNERREKLTSFTLTFPLLCFYYMMMIGCF